MRRSLPLAVGWTIVLSGCRANADYPTLALRPNEDVSFAEPAPRPAPPPTSADLADGRFAGFVARIRAGDAKFGQALAAARPVLAAGMGAPVGTDAWGAAQERLSRLQALRDPVAAAVSDLREAADQPDVRDDPGLAAAAERAMAIGQATDRAEAAAIVAAAPRRS